MWLCYTRLHFSAAAIMLGFGAFRCWLVTVYIVTSCRITWCASCSGC